MIEFYNITDKNRKNVLFALTSNLIENIDSQLTSRGVNIDLYGTTILYQSHINTIIEILKDQKSNNELDFFNFLIHIKNEGICLILEGD